MSRGLTVLLKKYSEEPYRIFFPLGILCGILGVSHWLFYALGWVKSYSSFFHSSVQMQAYMGCFVFGFLMTAMPRFVSAKPATFAEFFPFLILMILMNVLYFSGLNRAAQICFMSLILLFLRFAISRFLTKSPNAQPPVEFVWLPVAFLSGFSGALILILGDLKWISPLWLKAGKALAEQGFLLAVVTGIGGFLGPRLMGVHQIIKAGEIKDAQKYRRHKALKHLLAGALLFSSFLLEATAFQKEGAFLRALVVTWAFWTSRVLVTRPLVRDQFAVLLWISFWMIFLGVWGVAIFPAYRLAALHIVFIGGYALMTFSVATMVILSHAGMPEKLRKPHWALNLVGASLGAGVLIRGLSVFFTENYFIFIGTAAACWLIAAFGWLFFVIPYTLLFPANPEEAERCHEEAKQRIRDMREKARD